MRWSLISVLPHSPETAVETVARAGHRPGALPMVRWLRVALRRCERDAGRLGP